MPAPNSPVAVTGMGIVCSIAHDIPSFEKALREGRSGFSALPPEEGASVAVAGLVRDFAWRDWFDSLKGDHPTLSTRGRKALNNTTPSTRLSACAAVQAFLDAGMDDVASVQAQALDEVGIIVAGSNLAQEYAAQNWQSFYAPAPAPAQGRRLNPRYALSSFDSNQVGVLSEILSLRGMGYTLGAASASGNAALFNASQWISAGILDRCLVVGASADFSRMELEAFANLGAAGCGRFRDDPARACRPFDAAHEGFIWGQGSAAVMLESTRSAQERGAPVWGEIVGSSLLLDGNHLPDPSLEGEIRAMRKALAMAGIEPEQIGTINAHGSSSVLGDEVECEAIKRVFEGSLERVRVNSTKSLTGHCMSAGGVIELAACLIQLNRGFLHPNLNLEEPIAPELRFVGGQCEPCEAEYALSNGFGFGGINSSLIIRKTRGDKKR